MLLCFVLLSNLYQIHIKSIPNPYKSIPNTLNPCQIHAKSMQNLCEIHNQIHAKSMQIHTKSMKIHANPYEFDAKSMQT
jgi:hypothetical protein